MLTPLVLVAALAGVLLVLVWVGSRAPELTPSARRSVRHLRMVRVLGLGAALALVGAATSVVLTAPGVRGELALPLVLPLVCAAAHLVVVAAGELTWPRPSGRVRQAVLVRREVGEDSPRWLHRLLRSAGGLEPVVQPLGLVGVVGLAGVLVGSVRAIAGLVVALWPCRTPVVPVGRHTAGSAA